MFEYEAYMRCSYCGARVAQKLDGREISRLKQGTRPRRHCQFCVGQTEWEFLGWKGIPPEAVQDSGGEQTKPSLLMIDDDDLTVSLLRKVLEGDECVFEIAHDGKEALQKIKEQRYSLVICDIHMPNLDGKELFRILEDQGLDARKAILFLTGDSSEATRTFLEGTGCPYMYKPIQVLQFAEAVHEILAQRSAPEASEEQPSPDPGDGPAES